MKVYIFTPYSGGCTLWNIQQKGFSVESYSIVASDISNTKTKTRCTRIRFYYSLWICLSFFGSKPQTENNRKELPPKFSSVSGSASDKCIYNFISELLRLWTCVITATRMNINSILSFIWVVIKFITDEKLYS